CVIDPSTTTANADGHGHIEYVLDGSTSPTQVYSINPVDFSGLSSGRHLLLIHLVNNDNSVLTPDDLQVVAFVIRGGGGTAPGFQFVDPSVVFGGTNPGIRLGEVGAASGISQAVGQEQFATATPGLGIPTVPDSGSFGDP